MYEGIWFTLGLDGGWDVVITSYFSVSHHSGLFGSKGTPWWKQNEATHSHILNVGDLDNWKPMFFFDSGLVFGSFWFYVVLLLLAYW